MKATDLEAHRRNLTPVTVRHGRQAGRKMLVVGLGYAYATGDTLTAVPSHKVGDLPRVGLALYRPMSDDWVPFLALLSDIVDFEAFRKVSAWGDAEAALERSIREDARAALRSALKDARLDGMVRIESDGRLALVMQPGNAWNLAAALKN